MRIYSIYKATNIINGKSYIGFTAETLRKRKYRHSANVKSGKHCCAKFHRAILKYGWESFEWSILFQSLDKTYILSEMEEYFIQLYDSRENGYNIAFGGTAPQLGRRLTEEHKQKIRDAKKGISTRGSGWTISKEHREALMLSRLGSKHSLESLQKISQSLKGRTVWNKGIPCSEETKQKIRESKLRHK